MGLFGKPKQPDYAKIQEEARLKEEARLAEEEAKMKQATLDATTRAEGRRKAFYQGLTAQGSDTSNKRFMKGA